MPKTADSRTRGLALGSLIAGAISLASFTPLFLSGLKAGGGSYPLERATALWMATWGFMAVVLGGVSCYRSWRRSALFGGIWPALGGIATGALSIGIARLLEEDAPYVRCRYAYGETVGALRILVSAEEVYASANGGFYDVPRCLAAPTTCIPGYRENAPIFLEEDFWSQGRDCYQRRFHPGASAETGSPDAATRSPSSLKSYAFTAVPAPTYPYDSARAERFCTDSTGRICRTTDGSEPAVIDGLCAPPCIGLE